MTKTNQLSTFIRSAPDQKVKIYSIHVNSVEQKIGTPITKKLS
jgi:hypothetical protein